MKKTILEKVVGVWKYIFYVAVFVFLVFLAGLFFIPEIEPVFKAISSIFFAVNLLGMYGFVWRKKIFRLILWRCFFTTLILFDVFYLLFEVDRLAVSGIDMFFVLFFSFVMYTPIYLYAFDSGDLWK